MLLLIRRDVWSTRQQINHRAVLNGDNFMSMILTVFTLQKTIEAKRLSNELTSAHQP